MNFLDKNRFYNFAQVPSTLLRPDNGKKINMDAVAVMAYLSDKPDSWSFSEDKILKQIDFGRSKLRKALNYLEAKGFLKRTKIKERGGKFGGIRYEILAIPTEPSVEKPSVGSPSVEKPTDGEPSVGEPSVGKSTDISNKDKEIPYREKSIYNPPISPQKKGQQTPKYSDAFVRFWKAYPRKVAKQKTWNTWKRKKLDLLIDEILAGLEKYKSTKQWQKDGGKYIPYPLTWINGGCWEDDPVTIDKPNLTKQPVTGILDILTSPPEAFVGRLLNRDGHPFGEDDIEFYGRYFGYPPNDPIKTFAKLMHAKRKLPLADGGSIPNPFFGYAHEDDVPL